MGRVDLAGAAHLELVAGVVQLRPEDAMVEAMLHGWRAQQTARGLREETMFGREQLVRRFDRWATLDLSGPYRAVFDTMLPDATQVADPFHVVKLAN